MWPNKNLRNAIAKTILNEPLLDKTMINAEVWAEEPQIPDHCSPNGPWGLPPTPAWVGSGSETWLEFVHQNRRPRDRSVLFQ